jgi:molybdopterin-guanine dinucleotide biosynthesis protein A
MQRDKATLEYAGKPQLLRAMQLLQAHVVRAFVSVAAEQRQDPTRSVYDTIVDRRAGVGPIAGIEAALHAHPDQAWLVLACDLPFLDDATVRYLIEHRATDRVATAFRSSLDGKPEPLCAIFEPRARERLDAWLTRAKPCPRAFLTHGDVELLDLPNRRALDNINTVEEYSLAQAALGAPPAVTTPGLTRRLNVRYFAMLREQAGRSAEQLETHAANPGELYEELRRRHALTLPASSLRVAVNDEFGDWQAPLKDGDTVVFLPPVAGG